jgi:hypothetical protein
VAERIASRGSSVDGWQQQTAGANAPPLSRSAAVAYLSLSLSFHFPVFASSHSLSLQHFRDSSLNTLLNTGTVSARVTVRAISFAKPFRAIPFVRYFPLILHFYSVIDPGLLKL